MQNNIRRLGFALAAAFLLVAVALTYWQFIAAESLQNMPSNPRLIETEQRTSRGKILDRRGQPLATTSAGAEGQTRTYPLKAAAPVTGYHSFRYGDSGLEATYGEQLRGMQAADLLEQLRLRLFHTLPVGADVLTTIDARIQQAAARALGDSRGAIVVLDPRSGAIIALVSAPTFDVGEIDADFSQLRDDPSAPLFNRATQSGYVPGSTFKLVTAAAAVDRGLVDLNAPFACTTAVNLGGQWVDCKNSQHLPRLTYQQAFAWSSNRTFALSGLLLGFDSPMNPWLNDHPPGKYPWSEGLVERSARILEEYATRFGFGSTIPFDLPVEPSRLKNEGSPWTVALLASTAFGQGEISATPLQMALVAGTIANDGKVPRPFLVTAVRSANGAETQIGRPADWTVASVRPESARVLREFMVEGVEHGYAAKAHIDGISVGGKTGTAEVGPGQTPHAWFIGFAPVDTPRVAIAVVVEHGGSGADVATPIAREVMQVALDVYEPAGR